MTILVRPLRRLLAHVNARLETYFELALLFAIIAAVAVTLAFAAGWITAGQVTPVTIMEAVQAQPLAGRSVAITRPNATQ
jgi:hypothetical protein